MIQWRPVQGKFTKSPSTLPDSLDSQARWVLEVERKQQGGKKGSGENMMRGEGREIQKGQQGGDVGTKSW